LTLPAPLKPRAALALRGLNPKKRFGQNFLHDQSALELVAKAIGAGPEQPVLELGPGLGALTLELLKTGAKVCAVEKDRDLIPILRAHFDGVSRLELHQGDATSIDFESFVSDVGGALRVVGNLPYNVGSRIVVHIANSAQWVDRAVVMLQKEVVQRVVAQPGGRSYGLLSVLVTRTFDAHMLRVVSSGAFYPAPKVDSALMLLQRKAQRLDRQHDEDLIRCARAAFAQRRKTLRNCLKNKLKLSNDVLDKVFTLSDIDPACRAETLNLDDYNRLGAALRQEGCFDSHQN
jgi:16S rRNA (adenine1518-N6/adenine1519-N6)-dimethyltransferase